MTAARLQQAFYLGLATTTASLGAASLAAREWWLALAAAALGAIWGWARRRGLRWLGTCAFSALVLLAAIGVSQGLPGPWPLLAVGTGLVCWDLDQLLASPAGMDSTPHGAAYRRRHLGRLSAVAAGGIALGWLAGGIRLPLAFGVTAVLGLLGFLVIVWLAGRAWPPFTGLDSDG
jgi:hypothetical protein